MAIDLQAVLGIKKQRVRDFSERIWFVPYNITFRCGLNCQFCYGKQRTDQELSTQQVKTHIIDNIADSKARWMGFTGGDPLLREDIFELMAYAKEKGLEVLMSTNGQLLNPSRIEKLAEIGVTRIGIGISGLNNIYSKVMGGGTFETVDSMIRLCQDSGFEISLRAVTTKDNYSTFLNLVDYAYDLGVYKFCRYNMIYSGQATPALDISDSEKNALVIDLIKKQQEYPDLKMWLMERPYDYVLLSKMGYGNIIRKPDMGKCGAVKGLINVAPNGDVYPCPYFHDAMEPMGNLQNESIRDIALKPSRIRMAENVTGSCGDCEYMNICGGCRYHALKYGNDVLGGDPFCPMISTKTLCD